MKKLIMACAVVSALFVEGATYKQASQAWVQKKIDELEARIMANSSVIAGSETDEDKKTAIDNSTVDVISEASSVVSLISGGFTTPTNGVPFYSIGAVPRSISSVLPRGSFLHESISGVYTNANATLTEGGLTNRISVSGLVFLAPVGDCLFYTDMLSDPITAVKLYK